MASERIELDGLVLLKIVKHCTEALPKIVYGSILGLEVEDKLEVTNCYPVPADAGEQYQIDMMHKYREVNVDNNCVGWYRSAYLGSFLTKELVDQQLVYHQQLGPTAPIIVFDPFQTRAGKIHVKAFRLTKAFLDSQEAPVPTGDGEEAAPRPEPSQVLEEVPLVITNSKIVEMYLRTLDAGSEVKEAAKEPRLDMACNQFLEKNIELMGESIDSICRELAGKAGRLREWNEEERRHRAWVITRQNENRDREVAGLEARDAHDAAYKSQPRPSMVEAKLLSKQIETYCDQTNSCYSGSQLGSMLHKQ